MKKSEAYLAAFTLGGLTSIVEGLHFQRLFQALSVNDDRSAYFFSFLAYGCVCCLFLLLVLSIFKRLNPLASAVSIGITALISMAALYYGAEHLWKQSHTITRAMIYFAASMILLMVVAPGLYRLFARINAFLQTGARVLILAGMALFLCSFAYAILPPYRFHWKANKNSGLPNILLITMDTTRADHLGCFGYPKNTSPFIDSLAKRGVLFTNAYTPSTWTLPAHTSLFTGQMPSVHGVGFKNFFLSEHLTTLAQILKARGYETGGFIGGPFLSSLFHINKGFNYYDQELDQHRKLRRYLLVRLASRVLRTNLWPPDGNRRADEINQQVFPYLEWLKNRKPFFLFINYFDPHDPYDPPEYCLKLLGTKKTSLKGDIELYPLDKKSGIACHPDGTPLTVEEFQQLRDLYDGEIRYMDDQISHLWKQLETLGLLENTVVMILADHGETIGEHQFLDHGHALYQEQVRIPMILLEPGKWMNRVVDSPVEMIDLFPTILQRLNIELPGNIQGRSLIPLMQNPVDVQRPVLAELDEDSRPHFAAFRRSLRMILEQKEKYIEASNGANELFDLDSDPQELQNLFHLQPQAAAGDAEQMRAYFKALESLRHSGSGELDQETAERLKALGYVQ